MKDPAFLMYSKDWIEGTAEYMPEEKGVYIDLLCFQHQRGDLPSDLNRLAKMVGLPIDSFLQIWKTVSAKFEVMDDRLVNRTLREVMKQRSDKGKVNTITGTFAGLLRLGKFTSKEYKYLKDNFKVHDFIQYEKEEITERLTEWLSLCLKSIAIGNEDVTSYLSMYNTIKAKNEILIPEGFEPLILEWLKYKSEKKQTYQSETSLKTFIKTFIKDSGANIGIGREMLDYSISRNYAGLFEPKEKKEKQEAYSINDLYQ